MALAQNPSGETSSLLSVLSGCLLPPPSLYKYKVCKHTYDPDDDGEGVVFSMLSDDWVCPICGAPKSAYEPLPSNNVLNVLT